MVMSNSKLSKRNYKRRTDKATQSSSAQIKDAHKAAVLTVGAAGVLVGASLVFNPTAVMAENADQPVKPVKPQELKEQVQQQNVAAATSGSKVKVVDRQSQTEKAAASGSQDNKAAEDRATAPKNDATQADKTINISQQNKDKVPNMYSWGTADNVFSKDGNKLDVTINIAKPEEGKISRVVVFPAVNNDLTSKNIKNSIDYDSSDKDAHRNYSGVYAFTNNADGSACLKINENFRDGQIGAATKYAGNRNIAVYVTKMVNGKEQEVLLYRTNVWRAGTLVPPKSAGSIVLKYNEKLTADKLQEQLKEAAANQPTEADNNKTVNEQIVAASTAPKVGVTSKDKKFTNTPDKPEEKLPQSKYAYDQKATDAVNQVQKTETTVAGKQENTYATGTSTVNTNLVTDQGLKSPDIPVTVARYDDRIEKPVVDDPTALTEEQRNEIKQKLARLNKVATDAVQFDDQGNVTIKFQGVEESKLPKLKVSDLVIKRLQEKEIVVPAKDKATVIYNPIGYSQAELERMKDAIYQANKDNPNLHLTSKDQIKLSYVDGNTTVGKNIQGISNGMAENTITVEIKTDKAQVSFTSDVKNEKLTRLVDIRKDYDVSWTKQKMDGRESDEGFEWSEDHKTLIYRYDSSKAISFKSGEVLKLLQATAKKGNDGQPLVQGLRDLKGDEGRTLEREGRNGKPTKSHMHYVLDENDQPTGVLDLGVMGGPYWNGDPAVTNSDKDLGEKEAKVGKYTWDKEAQPIEVAAKDNQVFKARLFVAPYEMSYYTSLYGNPRNTTKAINVIFVPQTKNKKKDLAAAVDKYKLAEDTKKPTNSAYYNADQDKKDAYDQALKHAKEVLERQAIKGNDDDSKLSEQDKADIDNAAIKLHKAEQELNGQATDKADLQKSIDANGKRSEGSNPAVAGTVTAPEYQNVTDVVFLKPDGQPDTEKNNKAQQAKAKYDQALAAAEKINKDPNATQAEVDKAKAELDTAREALKEFSTNKDKLNAALGRLGKVNTGKSETGVADETKADPIYQNATDEEKRAYADALAKAQQLAADPNASQKDVNQTVEALKQAKAALDKRATNKQKLDSGIHQSFDNPEPDNESKRSVFYKNAKTKADNNDQDAQTAIDNYDQALQAAKEQFKNDKATQKQVDEALQKLQDSEKVLHEKYQTNVNDLTKALADNVTNYLNPAYFNAYNKAQKGDEQAKKDFQAYNEAYQKAKALKKKLEQMQQTPAQAPTQEEIDAAKKQLNDTRAIIDKYSTDDKDLQNAVDDDTTVQQTPAYKNVTACSNDNSDPEASEKAKQVLERYENALEHAREVLGNKLEKDIYKSGDKQGQEIPTSNIPNKDGDVLDPHYLDDIQSHAKGEALQADVEAALKELQEATQAFAAYNTDTQKLRDSVNKDDRTKAGVGYKNSVDPNKIFTSGADSGKEDPTGYAQSKELAKKYDEALAKAKEVLNKSDATQAEVNDALNDLEAAREAVEGNVSSTDDLKDLIKTNNLDDMKDSPAYRNMAEQSFRKPKADGSGYEPDTEKNAKAKAAKEKFDAAYKQAKKLMAKNEDDQPANSRPTQKEINEAWKALNEAAKGLSAFENKGDFATDTQELQDLVQKSESTDPATGFQVDPAYLNALYDKKSNPQADPAALTAFNDALTAAKNLLDSTGNTCASTMCSRALPSQKAVDEAFDNLQDAIKALKEQYKTNTEALQNEKDYCNDSLPATPEYKNAVKDQSQEAQQAVATFNEAKQKADELLNNPNVTQEAVDKQLQALQAARQALEKYQTDVKPLQDEVDDKNGQLKFEDSVPYKNALAQAQTAQGDDAKAKLADYNQKLQAANDLIRKVKEPDANLPADQCPTNEEVQKALTDLQAAKEAIGNAFKTDITVLQKEINDQDDTGAAYVPQFADTVQYKNLLAETVDGQKHPDLTAYEQALQVANDLIKQQQKPAEGQQGPTQAQVDEALSKLREIKSKIKQNHNTTTVDLQNEVNTDDDFQNSPTYRNAAAAADPAGKQAINAYQQQLQAAQELLDLFNNPQTQDDKRPTQAQIDAALQALKQAKAVFDKYSTNVAALAAETAKSSDPAVQPPTAGSFEASVEFKDAKDRKDPASQALVQKYETSLANARDILQKHKDPNASAKDKPSQAEVDAALKALQEAKSAIVNSYTPPFVAIPASFYAEEIAQQTADGGSLRQVHGELLKGKVAKTGEQAGMFSGLGGLSALLGIGLGAAKRRKRR